MRRKLSTADERAVQRFVDGAMSDLEAAGFRRRLEGEPALRQEMQVLQSLSAGFAADRVTGLAAPADFTRKLMRSLRHAPDDPSWRQHVLDDGQVVRWCRRILLVAAALLLAAAVWRSGLLPGQKPDALQAAPDVLQLEMQRLDARIREAGDPGIRTPGRVGTHGNPPSPAEGPRRK